MADASASRPTYVADHSSPFRFRWSCSNSVFANCLTLIFGARAA
jgi:hypothetical protein